VRGPAASGVSGQDLEFGDYRELKALNPEIVLRLRP
jgi:hypothetical protein